MDIKKQPKPWYIRYRYPILSGARSNDQEKGIDQDGDACCTRQDRISVTDIPRFRLFLYIHIILLLFISPYLFYRKMILWKFIL